MTIRKDAWLALLAAAALFYTLPLGAQEITVPTTRMVTGTDIGHYPNGALPVDLSALTIAAYAPNGSGGYTMLPGSGTSAGTFKIPNVPTGSYLLQLGSLFLVTSNSVVDADFTWDFRDNGIAANQNTSLTFNLANLAAWQDTDVFEVVCPNNSAFVEFDASAGATALTGTFPYAQFITANLSDASQGDQYVILQLSTQDRGGYPFSGASRAFFPPKFTQAQGSDTPVTGTLTTLPQTHEFEANIDGADLTAQVMASNPNVTLFATNVVLDAYPGSVTHGERTSTPDLVSYNLSWFAPGPNITTNTDVGKISYGNPFPASWPLFVLYDWYGQTNYTAPGATGSFSVFTFVQGYDTSLPSSTSPIKPLVGVVTNPTIDGQNFFGDQIGVGTTPTLRWSPPAIGKASFYEIDIIQLTNEGGSTFETALSTVRTQNTSLKVPQGLITAGQGYAFVIRSWYIPGLNFTKTPFMSGPISAFTDVVSGLMQP